MAAIAGLADGRGDLKPVQGNLEGLWRLRVGEHRIVYRNRAGRIEVFYAAPRNVVYEFWRPISANCSRAEGVWWRKRSASAYGGSERRLI